jgi:hypothetical protein
MDACVTGAAKAREIVDIARAGGVIPDRIDVMRVEAVLAAADRAAMCEPRVNTRGMLARPSGDIGTLGRDATLPEIRSHTTPCGSDDADVLFGVDAWPGERPALASLRDPGQACSLARVELKPEQPLVLPDGEL